MFPDWQWCILSARQHLVNLGSAHPTLDTLTLTKEGELEQRTYFGRRTKLEVGQIVSHVLFLSKKFLTPRLLDHRARTLLKASGKICDVLYSNKVLVSKPYDVTKQTLRVTRWNWMISKICWRLLFVKMSSSLSYIFPALEMLNSFGDIKVDPLRRSYIHSSCSFNPSILEICVVNC